MLTKKQHELLTYIEKKLAETGVSPSFDEMKEALNLRSKSGIHRLITGLEERGFIRRLPHRARALEILKFPENHVSLAPSVSESAEESAPTNIIQGAFDKKPMSPASPSLESLESSNMTIPLYGKIAAGTPIEAIADISNSIAVPPFMMGAGEHYALEVEGDSMIEAGIHDGDTVIISRCNTAENGTIVVALVDDEEVTLKRLRRKGNSVALEPANEAYETRICGPDQVKVQGKLVGLMRQY